VLPRFFIYDRVYAVISMKKLKTTAIIVGAGRGTRMGNQDKAFLKLWGEPILSHVLSVFEKSKLIDEIILVLRKEKISQANNIIGERNFNKVKNIVPGGESRQDSVYNALAGIKQTDFVVVHDVARPLATKQLLEKCILAAQKYGAAVPAIPIIDSIKKGDRNNFVDRTIERDNLWQVQTPQVFRYKIMKKAYEHAIENKVKATDDASLVEKIGQKVKIVPSYPANIKLTTQTDLEVIRALKIFSLPKQNI